MKNLIIITLVLSASGLLGFAILNRTIYQEKQEQNPGAIAPYQGTLTGTYTCLPHRDQSGPQTLECALGVETEAGEFYAVDWSQFPDAQADIQTGDRFRANGRITPIEYLSTDYWQKYAIVGIFAITDSVTKL